MVADRDAAGGDDDVGGRGGVAKGVGDRIEIVRHDAVIDDGGGVPGEQCRKHRGVARREARTGRRRAERHEFVAGRDQRDARSRTDGDGGVAADAGERDMTCGDPSAGRDQMRADCEVGRLAADVAAGLERALAGHRQPHAVARRLLLDQHAVGAGRDGRAGKDARRFKSAKRPVEAGAGRAFANDGPRAGALAIAYRIAVHRGQVVRRLVAQRDDRIRRPASHRLDERDVLDRQRSRQRKQARLRVCDGKQTHTSPLVRRVPVARAAARFGEQPDRLRSPCRDRPPWPCRRRSAARPRPRSSPPSRRRCRASCARSPSL